MSKINLRCPKCGRIRFAGRPGNSRPNSTHLCRTCYLKSPVRGTLIWNWNGGTTKDSRGYIFKCINAIENENLANLCRESVKNRAYGKKRSGRIYLHHLEMIKKLDRSLLKGEVVHHKDGDPGNNSIDNLVLTNPKDHIRSYRELLFRVKELEEEITKGAVVKGSPQ